MCVVAGSSKLLGTHPWVDWDGNAMGTTQRKCCWKRERGQSDLQPNQLEIVTRSSWRYAKMNGFLLYSFLSVARKYHRLSGLDHRSSFSHVLQKCEIKVSAGWLLLEALSRERSCLSPASVVAGSLAPPLADASLQSLPLSSFSACLCVQIPPFWQGHQSHLI